MILYGNSVSPYVRKVLAYLAEKGIAFDHEPVAPNADHPAFREASPFGKIPALRDGDFTLSDSTAIITYLEAVHPLPALIPAEPRSRARTIWYEEFSDTLVFATGRDIFFNRFVAPKLLGIEGDLACAERAEREGLPPILDYLESVIPPSGFLVDDRLTLADIAVASPFVNLAHLGITIDPGRYPKAADYLEAILARPSFAPIIEGERALMRRLLDPAGA